MSDNEIEQALKGRVRRLNAGVQGIVLGLFFGLGLFLATGWLVIRGGDPVGPHLSLLSYYFPGYSVTWPGALLGFAYGFASGFVAGYLMAIIYNALTRALRRS